MAELDNRPPEVENQNHRYVGNHIPWFVHLLWLSFWVFALAYFVSFFFPAIRREILTPP